MFLTIVLFIIGLILIIKGGDVFVDAATWMAEKTGIPKLIIGATVVSLATTLPEMLVSFFAAAEGKVDMAIGNAVGSVTANIGLIMGVALICMPAVIKRKDYMLKSILMLGSAMILMIFGFTGEIGLVPSIILLIIFAVAMYDNIKHAKIGIADSKLEGGAPAASIEYISTEFEGKDVMVQSGVAAKSPTKDITINLLKFIFGAVAIVLGSQLLVDNGSELARIFGVPERIIAVSVIAIGTSLPELVTTLSAIAKKQSALSIGNIIGANIFDLTLILPFSALISGKPLPVSSQFSYVDLPFCFLIGCIGMIPSLITKKFHRGQGIFMVVCYIAYLVVTMFVI